MGTWVANNDHYVDDLVTYNGSCYICIKDHQGSSVTPNLDTTNWLLFVSKGDTGATGPAGPTGPTGAVPNISMNATSLPANTSPTVSRTGTDANPIFTLGIPSNQAQQHIEITPSTATSGTLTTEQLSTLQSGSENYILLDNEIYKLQDNQTDSGYLVYTHTGSDNNNNVYIKNIIVTIPTRGWVKVTSQMQKKVNQTLLNATKYNITNNTQVPISKATLQQYSYILIEVECYDASGVNRTSRATGYFKVSDLVEYNTTNDYNSISFYSRRYALLGTINFTANTNNMIFTCEFAKPYEQTNLIATANDQIYIGNIWGIKY